MAIRALATATRNAALPPEERKAREAVNSFLTLVKTASAVAMAVVAIFVLLVPSIFTLLLFLPVGYVAYEIFTVSGNFNEILEDPFVEAAARISRQPLIEQLSKGAPLAKTILMNSPAADRILDNFVLIRNR